MGRRRLFNPDDSNFDFENTGFVRQTGNPVHPALLSSETPDHNVQKCNNNAEKHPKKGAKNSTLESVNVQGSDSDSDTEPVGVPDFFKKLPYTKEEDEVILQYVLKGQNIYKVGSILLWKHLEAKKENPRRTYQSLKNRFIRNIKPYLFTTYGHLIKDEATTKRILTKFPELKKEIKKRDTLSRIKLPERKPASKPPEEDRVSSSSNNEVSLRVPAPNDVSLSPVNPKGRIVPESPVRFQPYTIDSDSVKSVFYSRSLKSDGNRITVRVDFEVYTVVKKKCLGIYETYKKLQEKNILVLCTKCGRYNIPRVSSQSSNGETDCFIPNSVERASIPLESRKSPNNESKLKRNSEAKEKKKSDSEPQVRSPCSQSLLSDTVAEIHKGARDTEEDSRVAEGTVVSNSPNLRKIATAYKNKAKSGSLASVSESGKKTCVTTVSKSSAARKKAGNTIVRNSSQHEATASSSTSNEESNSGIRKRPRDSDEDLDSICHTAGSRFRKVIDVNEEQDLARKCLKDNFRSMGVNQPEGNWDTYFLESPSDLETPQLTIDYETDSENCETQSLSVSTGSSFAESAKKMTEKSKKS